MENKEFYIRNLPHIQPLGGTFFVTWNLKGAIPKERFLELHNEYKQKLNKAITKEDQRNAGKIYFKDYDNELHVSPGKHFLKDDRLAKIVANTLHFWDNKRMELISYCIMSNHVHIVLRIYEKDENGKELYLQDIIESIKKYSAGACNAILNRTSKTFWKDESYDRVVRDREELFRIIAYILDNPIMAGLCKNRKDWKWSYIKEEYNEFM